MRGSETMLEWGGGRRVGYWAGRRMEVGGGDRVVTEERAGRQYGGGRGRARVGKRRSDADVAEEGTSNWAVAAEQEQVTRTCGGGDKLDIEERERGRHGGKGGDEGELEEAGERVAVTAGEGGTPLERGRR
jgi:hypothetical protein